MNTDRLSAGIASKAIFETKRNGIITDKECLQMIRDILGPYARDTLVPVGDGQEFGLQLLLPPPDWWLNGRSKGRSITPMVDCGKADDEEANDLEGNKWSDTDLIEYLQAFASWDFQSEWSEWFELNGVDGILFVSRDYPRHTEITSHRMDFEVKRGLGAMNWYHVNPLLRDILSCVDDKNQSIVQYRQTDLWMPKKADHHPGVSFRVRMNCDVKEWLQNKRRAIPSDDELVALISVIADSERVGRIDNPDLTEWFNLDHLINQERRFNENGGEGDNAIVKYMREIDNQLHDIPYLSFADAVTGKSYMESRGKTKKEREELGLKHHEYRVNRKLFSKATGIDLYALAKLVGGYMPESIVASTPSLQLVEKIIL